jgi:hypothetical protein
MQVLTCTGFRAFGHYNIEGVGYATIQDVLLGGRALKQTRSVCFRASRPQWARQFSWRVIFAG